MRYLGTVAGWSLHYSAKFPTGSILTFTQKWPQVHTGAGTSAKASYARHIILQITPWATGTQCKVHRTGENIHEYIKQMYTVLTLRSTFYCQYTYGVVVVTVSRKHIRNHLKARSKRMGVHYLCSALRWQRDNWLIQLRAHGVDQNLISGYANWLSGKECHVQQTAARQHWLPSYKVIWGSHAAEC